MECQTYFDNSERMTVNSISIKIKHFFHMNNVKDVQNSLKVFTISAFAYVYTFMSRERKYTKIASFFFWGHTKKIFL